MAAVWTKTTDGDEVWGKHRLEHVTLQPSISDYATGGYLVQGIAGTTESTGNIGIEKVGYVIPIGGQGGVVPVYNPTTSKMEMYLQTGSSGALTQASANTDFSAYTFNFLVVGY